MSNTFRVTDWDCTWNSIALGLVNEVNPDLKIKFMDIKRGTTGEHVLGRYMVALEGSVKVVAKDVTAAMLLALMPWSASGTIFPVALNQDLYAYAQLLNLHPHDVAAATHTEDINLVKAVPINCVNLKRDGKSDDQYEIEFQIFPDRAQLVAVPPVVVYGYLGPTP